MPSRPMRIAQLGTFDVANYGDLLFPLLARRRLRLRFPDLRLDAVSPAGGPPVWPDCDPAMGWDDFIADIGRYDAILVGGGNIVRLNPTDLAAYAGGLTPLLAYPRLWALVAAHNPAGVPVLWNAPGVPAPFPPDLVPLLRQAMAGASYVAVRDEGSRANIAPLLDGVEPAVVPDTAWDLPKLWGAEARDAAWAALWSRHGRAVPARALAIHLNARYLGGASAAAMASLVDEVARAQAATPILVAIGPCHGDDALAREVGGQMRTGPLVLDAPAGLAEIAAAVSRSALYLGSSMHGFVTAAAHGVPAVIVGRASMAKFDGMLAGLGLPELRQDGWPEAAAFAARADWPGLLGRMALGVEAASTRLDAHWDRICAEVERGRAPAATGAAGSGLQAALLGQAALDLLGRNRELAARVAEASARSAAERQAMARTIDVLEARRDRAEARLREAERRLQQSKANLQRAERETGALRASTSWRVTAPLRAVMRLAAGRSPRKAAVRTPEAKGEPAKPPPGWRALPQAAQEVTVVIAVWNAVDDLRRCLASVVRHAMPGQRVIVVDDASPDPAIAALLAAHAGRPGWTILTNAGNLGYTRTVNRGVAAAGPRDVILLNSDTIVTPNWVQRLRHAAHADPRRGTVTPVSNAAGAFSVPRGGADQALPDGVAPEDYGRRISQALPHALVPTPTGSGFCLYMKRAMLDETGPFDEAAFPRGYGEENDLCMRAGAKGWTHAIDFGTFVWHRRSASFGEAKAALLSEGRRVVDARHPGYTAAVKALVENPAAQRHRARIADIGAPGRVRPRILFVISTKTGGTPQTNLDLMRAVEGAVDGFLMRCDSRRIELSRLIGGQLDPVGTIALSRPIEPRSHGSGEYDAHVARILHDHAIEAVHLRHLAWHGLGLVDVAKSYGLPVLHSFHDFYTLCPTVKLLDEVGEFCGGTCTAGPGPCRVALWPEGSLPDLKHGFVRDWRARFSAVLERCDGFVTTSPTTRAVIERNLPWIAARPFDVVPHGRDIVAEGPAAPAGRTPPAPGETLRVLVLGNINAAKGNLVYRAMAPHAAALGLEFHALGNWQGDPIDAPGFVHHGPYRRDDLGRWIAELRPHCGMILSIWPETYCHTLTECWSFGLPVFGFDTGAVGERMAASGGGWPIGRFDADAVLEAVRAARDDPAGWAARLDAVRRWNADPDQNPSTEVMGRRYLEIYARHLPLCGAGAAASPA